MTQEQKAKAYDEALKVAHRLYEQGTITESLSYIFPELKESEEGKVRKALIEMVHDTTGDSLWVDYNIHKEEALAWLEKQGEEKLSLRPQNRWKPSDEQMEALNYVLNLMASSESPTENDLYYNILKSLREQLKKLREE